MIKHCHTPWDTNVSLSLCGCHVIANWLISGTVLRTIIQTPKKRLAFSTVREVLSENHLDNGLNASG